MAGRISTFEEARQRLLERIDAAFADLRKTLRDSRLGNPHFPALTEPQSRIRDSIAELLKLNNLDWELNRQTPNEKGADLG